MITKNGTIVLINAFNTDGDIHLKVLAKEPIDYFNLQVTERNTERTFSAEMNCRSNCIEYNFKIDNPLLWSVTDPNLYYFVLHLKGDSLEEHVSDVFAFRTIGVLGNDILLNGNPIFIRGYIRGAKAHEHGNNCGLSESDFYAKNISAKRIKIF